MYGLSGNVQIVRSVLACVLAGAGCIANSFAVVAAPPTLSHLLPAGGQRGTKVLVTASGSFTWPVKVWSPGVEAIAVPDSGKLEITIPPDLAADRVWLRLYSAEGATIATPFLIGSLPELMEQEPNNAPKSAQKVTATGCTLNGVLESGDVDSFSCELQAGQTLVAAVDAYARLGSPMDAVLQIVSPAGVVLAENHDDLQLDPRLAFTARKSGVYIVRLFAFSATPDTSVSFHGGANYVYRLTLTTGPYITHAAELAVPQAQPGAVDVRGWNIPAATKLPVTQFAPGRLAEGHEFEAFGDLRPPSEARIGLVYGAGFAGGARLRIVPRATTEPHDPRGEIVLPPPTCVTGRLQTPRQSDAYRMPLKKGQTVVIVVESQSLGLPLDPVLQLSDAEGKIAAEVDDTGATRDALIVHTAAHDGDYRITVRDQFRQATERGYYRLTVRLEEPDFELSAAADAVVVGPEKPGELAIKIVRRGVAPATVGPIRFEVAGLPPGVTVPTVISEPTGTTTTEVKLVFTATGPAYSGPMRIVGNATQLQDRGVRTPPKLGVSLETIWLTVLEKPKP